MKFDSRIVKDSAVDPSVRFTLNKMTEGRRIAINLRLADHRRKVMEMVAAAEALAQGDGREVLPALREVAEYTDNHITPEWVRWGLHKIEGLEIDGAPATVETLIQSGPPALYREIAAEIRAAVVLTETAKGESGSPTTSGAAVVGETSGTTATPAETPDGTAPATAESTSPAT